MHFLTLRVRHASVQDRGAASSFSVRAVRDRETLFGSRFERETVRAQFAIAFPQCFALLRLHQCLDRVYTTLRTREPRGVVKRSGHVHNRSTLLGVMT